MAESVEEDVNTSSSESDGVTVNYFNKHYLPDSSTPLEDSCSCVDVLEEDSRAHGDNIFRKSSLGHQGERVLRKARTIGDRLTSVSDSDFSFENTRVPEVLSDYLTGELSDSEPTGSTCITNSEEEDDLNEVNESLSPNESCSKSHCGFESDVVSSSIRSTETSFVSSNNPSSTDLEANGLSVPSGEVPNGIRIAPNRKLILTLPAIFAKKGEKESPQPKSFIESDFGLFDEELWNSIDQPGKSCARDLVLNMIREAEQPDVKVYIGNVAKFKCHSIVLKCYSDLCKEMTILRELHVPDSLVTAKGFEKAYEWMLNDKALMQYEGIVETYQAAKFLKIPGLSQQIWRYLDDFSLFREETACFTFLAAKAFNDLEIAEVMLRRIHSFFIILLASPEFLKLSGREVHMLLSAEMIGVNSEVEVLLAAVLWLNYKWPLRKDQVVMVLKAIRFSELPPLYIVNLHTKSRLCPEIERAIKDKEVEKMIYDGFMYGHVRNSFNENLGGNDKETNNLSRQLIYDPNCEYHHTAKCMNSHLITYAAFQKHLKKVNSVGTKYYYNMDLKPAEDPKIICCDRPMFKPL